MKETIDLTPTKEGYIHMLTVIIESSTKPSDIKWAKNELFKLARG